MTEEKKKRVVKPAKDEEEEEEPESMFEIAMRVLKKDHNWKFFAGMVILYGIMRLVYG